MSAATKQQQQQQQQQQQNSYYHHHVPNTPLSAASTAASSSDDDADCRRFPPPPLTELGGFPSTPQQLTPSSYNTSESGERELGSHHHQQRISMSNGSYGTTTTVHSTPYQHDPYHPVLLTDSCHQPYRSTSLGMPPPLQEDEQQEGEGWGVQDHQIFYGGDFTLHQRHRHHQYQQQSLLTTGYEDDGLTPSYGEYEEEDEEVCYAPYALHAREEEDDGVPGDLAYDGNHSHYHGQHQSPRYNIITTTVDKKGYFYAAGPPHHQTQQQQQETLSRQLSFASSSSCGVTSRYPTPVPTPTRTPPPPQYHQSLHQQRENDIPAPSALGWESPNAAGPGYSTPPPPPPPPPPRTTARHHVGGYNGNGAGYVWEEDNQHQQRGCEPSLRRTPPPSQLPPPPSSAGPATPVAAAALVPPSPSWTISSSSLLLTPKPRSAQRKEKQEEAEQQQQEPEQQKQQQQQQQQRGRHNHNAASSPPTDSTRSVPSNALASAVAGAGGRFSLFIHRVQFRHSSRLMVFVSLVAIGTPVIVGGDRGVDLGCIAAHLNNGVGIPALPQPYNSNNNPVEDDDEDKQTTEYRCLAERADNWILRPATNDEIRRADTELRHFEDGVLTFLSTLTDKDVGTQVSKMRFLDVEAQFDQKKITVYYQEEAQFKGPQQCKCYQQTEQQQQQGVRFSPLAKLLYRNFPARIWFERVPVIHVPGGEGAVGQKHTAKQQQQGDEGNKENNLPPKPLS